MTVTYMCQELKLKDKECERLSQVRNQLEQELEELTASLFEVSSSQPAVAILSSSGALWYPRYEISRLSRGFFFTDVQKILNILENNLKQEKHT